MSASDRDDLKLRLREAETALAEALQERARLWDDANRRRAAERELAEVRKMVAQMQGSPSWRITAPLRSGKRAWQRRRGLAKRILRALSR